MSDFTTVYFTWIKRGFNIPSTLVEFSLFGNEISIKFYGVIIAFGFILAALFGGRMAYKWRISLDKMLDVLIYGTLAGIIGARAYYVIFQWDYYKLHPAEIPQIWQGGLAIYGGIIGGLIAALIVCKVRKINILNLLDMGGISLLIGQGIGRWGNFFNAEAYGTLDHIDFPFIGRIFTPHFEENYPLRMVIENGFVGKIAVHPTFLYESVWNLLGLLLIHLFFSRKRFDGEVALWYFAWYGFGRFFIEGMRDDSLMLGSFRVSQILALVLFAASIVLIVIGSKKAKKNAGILDGYITQFEKSDKTDGEE